MILLLFFILGLAICGVFNDYASIILIMIGFIFFLFSSYKTHRIKNLIVYLLILFAGMGYYYIYNTVTVNKYDDVENKNEILNITVISEPEYFDNRITFEGKEERYNKNLFVTLYDTPYLSSYDKITLKGNVYSIDTNKESYYSKGIYYKVVSYDKNTKITEGKGFLKSVSNLKNKIIFILDTNFSSKAAMLLKGVILGDDNYRTDEFSEALKKLSLSHIVSVSGMHFSIITMMFLFILRRLRISRKISSLINIPLSFLLAVFIGLTPSIIRVLIMTTVLSLADLFDREKVTDIYLLLLTAVIMLFYNIYYIHNIAFILSFASLAGILIYQKRLSNKLTFLPFKIREIISVTLSANICTLPFVIYFFNGLPVLSVLANLIIVPLITYMMIYGIIVIAVSMLFMKAGKIIGIPLDYLSALSVTLIDIIGQIPFSYFETLFIDKYIICIYFLALYIFDIKLLIPFNRVISFLFVLYFALNLFLPVDRLILHSPSMYIMCGENSGKGILTYKNKTMFINASSTNGTYYYDLINKECNGYFNIYVSFNVEGVKYIYNNDIKVKDLYLPYDLAYNEYFKNMLSKYCENIIPLKDEITVGFYDFNLTLKPKDSYNILEATVAYKDRKIKFSSEEIKGFDYNIRYVLPYYKLDEYKDFDVVINCFKDEVERVKI